MVDNLTRRLERRRDHVPQRNVTPREARRRWRQFRQDYGYGDHATALLTEPKAQPKAAKNGTPTYVLHLAPYDRSGHQVCSFATEGCAAACLNTAGRGKFDAVQRGRVAKTRWLAADPDGFLALLRHEIELAVKRHGGRALFRLNGTSDLRWERIDPRLFEVKGASFYDYTKWPKRDDLPSNYRLIYSVSERNSDKDVLDKLEHYGHVAVVVDTPAPVGGGRKLPLPKTYLGVRAWDGDETDDWRRRPGITLLRVKGDGVGDTSGFVRPTHA